MSSFASTVFTSAQERLPTGKIASGAITTIYILLIVVAILTCVLVADRYFPFLPVNPFGGPSALARDVKRFWTTASAGSENLIVPKKDSPTFNPDVYTMSIQFILGESRTPSEGQFRHILHRGTKPSCTDTSPDSDYNRTGLPTLMNPGIFLDKYKNDIHVFVHTRGKEGDKDVLLLESMTVEDLPLQQSMSIGIVCNGKNFEVYMNCKLYSTILLKGTPYLPDPDNNQWFGRFCKFPMPGIIRNLQLWSTALSTDDYKNMCRSVDIGPLPKVCPTD